MNPYVPSRVLYVDFELTSPFTGMPHVEAVFRDGGCIPILSYMPLQRGTHNVLACTGSEAIH
jgi:hypothetical protein